MLTVIVWFTNYSSFNLLSLNIGKAQYYSVFAILRIANHFPWNKKKNIYLPYKINLFYEHTPLYFEINIMTSIITRKYKKKTTDNQYN